jgi:hypothetical protein
MLQIDRYRFSRDLIWRIDFRSDGGERGGAGLTGVARVPVICASASNGDGDAAAPGTPGDDDEVRRMTASTTVVVAMGIGWRQCAEGQPELAGAAGFMRAIRVIPLAIHYESLQREERGQRGFYKGCLLGEGASV